jgi:hypothetical protein
VQPCDEDEEKDDQIFISPSRGEGGYLATGVSWQYGHNSQRWCKLVAPGNLYCSMTSSESSQQVSELYELWLKRGVVFYFFHRRK